MAFIPRIHAFEWEDQSWFPSFLRDCMTDFLEFIARIAKMYKTLPEELNSIMQSTEKNEILDLGSGAGGPWNTVLPKLTAINPEVRVTLSDYYPNLKAFKKLEAKHGEHLNYISEPIDARNVVQNARALRTQFLSLHHFKPEGCVQIFKNAVENGAPIVIVEGQSRNLPSTLAMLLSPINVLLMTPFIRPFRWDRLLFTYLIPILPILILWDGVISVLRTYDKGELLSMVKAADPHSKFNWTFKKLKGTPVTLFVGTPIS